MFQGGGSLRCVCARHIFFYTLITPECDTPQSRVDGCTLNENHKFYSLHYFHLQT